MALAVDRAVKPQHKQTLFELLPLLQLVPFTTSPALPSINQMQIQCMQTSRGEGRDNSTGQFKSRADDRKQLFKVRSYGIIHYRIARFVRNLAGVRPVFSLLCNLPLCSFECLRSRIDSN